MANPVEGQLLACQLLAEFLHADRASYAEVDEHGNFLIAISHHHPRVNNISGCFPIVSFGIALMDQLRQGNLLVINDVQAEPLLNAVEVNAYSVLGVRSYIAAPLLKEGRFLGVLGVQGTDPRHWTEGEVLLVKEVADRTWEAAERARIEQALRHNEARYRQLFDSIDQGFCIIEVIFDAQQRAVDYLFIEANPAFFQQTGLSDAIGKRILDLAPTHEQFWFDTYGRIALTGNSERFEHKAIALECWFEVFAFRLGPPEKHQVAVLFADIQIRKKAEEALLQASKAKDNFLAVASHELKNPLNLIQLNSELLTKLPESQTQPLINRSAETIKRTVKGLVRMVDELLDLCRGNKENLTLNLSLVNLSDVVQTIASAMQKEAAFKMIELSCEIQQGVLLHADSTRIQQIIWNLLSNAVKFTNPKGNIVLKVYAEDYQAMVEVIDNGVGIAADTMPNIFNMFAQEESFSNRQKGGLGIGLAMPKNSQPAPRQY